MTHLVKLNDDELSAVLCEIPSWGVERNRLKRILQFSGFSQAFEFMIEVARVAEQMNHHPEWRNIYDTVEIELQTHDVGGISRLDIQLAAAIDVLSRRFDAIFPV